ncbi:hypothetical protein [Acinetobacter sp. MD2(2019)]|uniref:hypothetical protein n=1 Tax=Acinetobacter sp. MD2(2019) TaxID=2605273 RepID=UPI002D1F9866|nr:hypothetical protein [Acinetobacter sp. MD2(2019)]MEB3753305.1 hypothetical protein [Acinetobacter sp. MD2(2019)]
MALDVGADFKTRWLNAPQAVRQTYLNDLGRICTLLNHETRLDEWLHSNKQAQLESYASIEQSYADLKAELIEAARVRKQHKLEQNLLKKRDQQQRFAQTLQQDELQQQQAQTAELQHLQQQVLTDFQDYAARYQKTPSTVSVAIPQVQAKTTTVVTPEIQEALDNLKIRLELEAESLIAQIESAVKNFNSKLQLAAEEEISYLIKKD